MKFSSIIFIGISILRRNPEKFRDCHGHKYKTINISNTNPIMRKSAILLSLATVAMALISCQKETPEVPSLVPLKSISVTCDGETAEGVIDDAAKTIKFVFNNCEQFTSVDITADGKDGQSPILPLLRVLTFRTLLPSTSRALKTR